MTYISNLYLQEFMENLVDLSGFVNLPDKYSEEEVTKTIALLSEIDGKIKNISLNNITNENEKNDLIVYLSLAKGKLKYLTDLQKKEIKNLNEKVNKDKNELKELNSKLLSIFTNDVTKLKKELHANTSRLETLNTQVKVLESLIKEWNKKFTNLASQYKTTEKFVDLPENYSEEEVAKTIVLLTDIDEKIKNISLNDTSSNNKSKNDLIADLALAKGKLTYLTELQKKEIKTLQEQSNKSEAEIKST